MESLLNMMIQAQSWMKTEKKNMQDVQVRAEQKKKGKKRKFAHEPATLTTSSNPNTTSARLRSILTKKRSLVFYMLSKNPLVYKVVNTAMPVLCYYHFFFHSPNAVIILVF